MKQEKKQDKKQETKQEVLKLKSVSVAKFKHIAKLTKDAYHILNAKNDLFTIYSKELQQCLSDNDIQYYDSVSTCETRKHIYKNVSKDIIVKCKLATREQLDNLQALQIKLKKQDKIDLENA